MEGHLVCLSQCPLPSVAEIGTDRKNGRKSDADEAHPFWVTDASVVKPGWWRPRGVATARRALVNRAALRRLGLRLRSRGARKTKVTWARHRRRGPFASPRYRRTAGHRECRKQQPLAPESAPERPVFGGGLTRDGRSGWADQGARIGPKAAPLDSEPGVSRDPRQRLRPPMWKRVWTRCRRQEPAPNAEDGDGADGLRPPDEACRLSAESMPVDGFSVSHGIRVLRAEPSLRVS